MSHWILRECNVAGVGAVAGMLLMACLPSQSAAGGERKPVELYHHQAQHPIYRFNPIAVPRPAPDAREVPRRTSFYLVLRAGAPGDRVLPDSVSVQLEPEGGAPFFILSAGRKFATGYSGDVSDHTNTRYGGPGIAVYVESDGALEPQTRYTVRVQARSRQGAILPDGEGTWSFTTELKAAPHRVSYEVNVRDAPHVEWKGEFFNAFAKPSFSTSSRSRIPHYELIAETQKEFPRAWTLQRDAYLAGFAHQPTLLKAFPNIVREQETRRIKAIERQNDSAVLLVEDFFGHEQYGIESDRPLSADYHPEDEVLIADGVSSARAFVIDTDDGAGTVRVTPLDDPPEGWKIAYSGPLPVRENPHAPGLFPPGGTYLRKFRPVGTPRYYWGRVNHEWDLVVKRYRRRVIPRFAGAIGCTAIDGASGTTAKDYAQWHQVVYDITSYLIGRYGDATVEWPWIVLNEPDLMRVYWRNEDWHELQKFYAYTADAILRAFEDHQYDSSDVMVGGLELGAIAGTRLRLEEFLIHCSPNATGGDALTRNKAYADSRLDGKRSRRTEQLCGANEGRGVPIDFLSIHTYNDSRLAAAKLIRAKEIALEIDPVYYETLPIVSHETVPTWQPIPDPGAAEMYLGNGYFTSWAADFKSRLLQRAAEDPRYAYGGDLVLMLWPSPARNFNTINDVVRSIRVGNRTELIPKPIHHYVNLLSTLGPSYWVFPEREIGHHTVSGFASPTADHLRIVLYAHNIEDTQSRSDAEIDVRVGVQGLDWDRLRMNEYRFDRDHNSYYHLARELRKRPCGHRWQSFSEDEFARIKDQAAMKVTRASDHTARDGSVALTVRVQGNGTSFLVLQPIGK